MRKLFICLKRMNKDYVFRCLDRIVSFVFIFFIFILAFLYIYHRNLVFIVSVFFLVIISLILIIGFLLLLDRRNVFKKIFFLKITALKLNVFRLFFLFFFCSFLLANFFLIFLNFFDFNRIFYIEYSLVKKIFLILFFYFFYFLLNISLGEKFLSFFKEKNLNKRDELIFSYAFGFSFFSLSIFLIAFFGLLFESVILILLIGTVLFSYSYLKRNLQTVFNYFFKFDFFDKKKQILVFVFIVLSLQFIFIFKPVPITTDSLHTYWNAPLEYVRSHSFLPMTNARTASASQNNEMIYAGIIALFDTKYIIHFQFFSFVFFLFVIYRLVELYFNKKIASLAVLSSLLIPWNFYYLYTVKVEVNVLLFSAIVLLAVYKYFLEQKNVFLFLFAWFSGILLGIKYSGVFLILPLFIFLFFYLFNNYKLRIFLKYFVLAVFVCCLSFSPWLIKNCYYFQQPFHPSGFLSFNNTDNTALYYNKEFRVQRSNEIHQLRHASGEDANLFLKFIHQTTGKNIDKYLWINYGLASPLFLLLFFLLAKKNSKLQYLNLLFFIYFVIWNFLGGNRPWYGIFGYTFISFLLLFYIFKYKYLKYLYLGFLFCIGFIYIEPFYPNLAYLNGQISADEYKYGQLLYLKTADYINQSHILDNSRLFLVGDTAVATIKQNGQKIISDPYFSKIGYSLNKGDNFLKNDLINNNFSYLIYSRSIDLQISSWPQNNKNISLGEYLDSYSGEIPSLYHDIIKLRNFLDNYAELIFDDGFYKLYKII